MLYIVREKITIMKTQGRVNFMRIIHDIRDSMSETVMCQTPSTSGG